MHHLNAPFFLLTASFRLQNRSGCAGRHPVHEVTTNCHFARLCFVVTYYRIRNEKLATSIDPALRFMGDRRRERGYNDGMRYVSEGIVTVTHTDFNLDIVIYSHGVSLWSLHLSPCPGTPPSSHLLKLTMVNMLSQIESVRCNWTF